MPIPRPVFLMGAIFLVPLLASCARHGGVAPVPMGTGKIQVSQAVTVPATAYEASRGYDARVNLRIECVGTPPAWWGELWKEPESARGTLMEGNKAMPGRLLHLPTNLDNAPGAKPGGARVYATSYLVRTKGLAGSLQLQDDLPLLKPGGGFGKAAVQVNVPVVIPKKSTAVLAVSHAPGARIERVSLVNGAQAGNVNVSIAYRPLKPATTGNIAVHILDAHGKEWPYQGKDDSAASIDQTTAVHEANLSVRVGTIPASAGALTLKGQVIWGDAWPAEFTLPLRNGSGKVIEDRPPGITFSVLSTTSRFYPAIAGVHAEAVVHGPPSANLAGAKWSSSPHPVLVDAAGKSYSLARSLAFSKGVDGSQADNYKLGWFVPIKLLPKGIAGLKLKTWLSADNGPQIPVTVSLDRKAINP